MNNLDFKMTTLEELQAALDALSELEANEYWRRGDYSENHKTLRAVLEAAISKMETTTEQSSEVVTNGMKPIDFRDVRGILKPYIVEVGAENAHTEGLLPCPFCGEQIIHDESDDPQFYFECSDKIHCGMQFNFTADNEEMAFACMNTRANRTEPAQTVKPIEGLKEALHEHDKEDWNMSDENVRILAKAARAYLTLTKREGV